MKLIPRRRALPAALISALCATALAAGPSAAGTFGSEAARVVGTEQSALGAAAGLRVAALSEAARPPARAAEPAAAAALSKAAPAAGSATDSLPNAVSSADLNCLAQAIYFESRGEPLDGQIAVAEVVLNRVDDRRFPRTVCGVTNQGCQFSYTCDGNSDVMKSAESRRRSEKIAAMMLSGHPRSLTDGATYFHTRSVRPDWSRRFTRTTTIGHHMFYRPATQMAGG